ncbi:RidA family protein [Chryseobacterium sp. DT-3]|uniref:RidA family protein n=1 Tax=Chryseobacterium sp. DT-3 TaxID=3396164 RepID=UPI003F1E24E9
MEKRTVNPWKWQADRSYSQAVEVRNVQSTLYCAGQAAIDPAGISSNGDMKSQLLQAITNLEEVISLAGYECSNIIKLNVYSTSTDELLPHFEILQEWISRHKIEQALTVLEVSGLFETLKVELQATAVR